MFARFDRRRLRPRACHSYAAPGRNSEEGARRTPLTQSPPIRTAVAVVLTLLAGCDGATGDESVGEIQQPLSGRNFGVYAAKSFENGWLGSLAYQWGMSNGFVSAEQSYGTTKTFYYNLSNNRALYWHDTRDGWTNGLDTVDLFFSTTHGAYDWPYQPPSGQHWAVWAMYEDHGDTKYPNWTGSAAYSDLMRLGDDSLGLSVFATYSGDTMHVDSYWWTRWAPIMNGGLRIALGCYGAPTGGSGASSVGQAFADYLEASSGTAYSIDYAWMYGLEYVDANAPAATIATGTGIGMPACSSDCWRRMNDMTWANMKNGSYPRLRNDQSPYVGCGCIRTYN